MRYADARIAESERDAIYRAYVAEHLRAIVGSDISYVGLTTQFEDFDAEQVVDGVISKMGLEEG